MPSEDISMFKKQNGHYNASMLTWRYINANPEILGKITRFANENSLPIEIGPARLVWHCYNDIRELPHCACGTALKFRDMTIGYAEYCSRECQGASKKVKSNRQNTAEKKYGVSHVFKSETIKDKIKETMIERYDVDNISKSESAKKQKTETCMRNHGVAHPMQSEHVRRKSKRSCVEKWGETNPWKNKEFRDNQYAEWLELFGKLPSWKESARAKRLSTASKKYAEKMSVAGIKIISDNGLSLTAACEKCGENYEILKYLMYQRIVRYKHNPCTKCNPISNSSSESEIEVLNYVKTVYDGEVRHNVRIDGMELDIYAPEISVAIEYDGLYWHSTLYRDKNYHINKTEHCAKLGIRLIHIFEDEWKYKRDIVKSIICGLFKVKHAVFPARKCEVIELSNAEYENFVLENHIQGYGTASVRIGLKIKGELLSVMSFSKLRGIYRKSDGSENEYEMIRYCSKIGITVIGGASRMLAAFVSSRKPGKITTYSDMRYFQGMTYEKIGFAHAGNTPPNYWYVIGDVRSHRFNHRKSVLVKNGADPAKTETQIMAEKGILAIYDCGNARYVLNLNSDSAL